MFDKLLEVGNYQKYLPYEGNSAIFEVVGYWKYLLVLLHIPAISNNQRLQGNHQVHKCECNQVKTQLAITFWALPW